MNPQGWPGLWPDAQHSLLTPSRPLRGCQMPAGVEVGNRAEQKGRRACVKAAGGAVPADGSKLAGLSESQGAKSKGPRMGTRAPGSQYESHPGIKERERHH